MASLTIPRLCALPALSSQTTSQLPFQAFLSPINSRVERTLERFDMLFFSVLSFKSVHALLVLLQLLIEAKPHPILTTQVLPLRFQVVVQLIDLLSD